jgi:hypothetical protein
MRREQYLYCFKGTNPGATRPLLHQHGAADGGRRREARRVRHRGRGGARRAHVRLGPI